MAIEKLNGRAEGVMARASGQALGRVAGFFGDISAALDRGEVNIRYGIGEVAPGSELRGRMVVVTVEGGVEPIAFTPSEARDLASAMQNSLAVLGNTDAVFDMTTDIVMSLNQVADLADDPDYLEKRRHGVRQLAKGDFSA